jgi:hypothetical protein
LRSELSAIRLGVCEHATDTAWCGQGKTVVDWVSNALGDGGWYNDVNLKEMVCETAAIQSAQSLVIKPMMDEKGRRYALTK